MVFVTGRLRLSGLEGIFIEGITPLGPFKIIFMGAVRVDEGLGEKLGFTNVVELDDNSVFLLFVGVSGKDFSGTVVVSKAACTWVYTLEKSLGFRQAAA